MNSFLCAIVAAWGSNAKKKVLSGQETHMPSRVEPYIALKEIWTHNQSKKTPLY